jgi:DNA-binding PadR family transcriptional regulator
MGIAAPSAISNELARVVSAKRYEGKSIKNKQRLKTLDRTYHSLIYLMMSYMKAPDAELPDDVQALLPLTPAVFYVLFALTAEDQHGYSIMQAVQTLSEGVVTMGPGTLYSTIQRLVNLDLVEETTHTKRPEELERRRRFYRLTGLGRKVFDIEIERLKGVLRQVRLSRLSPVEP